MKTSAINYVNFITGDVAMKYKKRLKKQSGVTLIELGAVLVVAGVIGIAALMFVPPMLAQNNAKKISDSLTMAIPKIQAAYQMRTSFNGLDTAQVATKGWFLDSMVQKNNGVPSGILVTPWANGTITFATTGTGGVQGQVTITGVTPAVCNAMADSLLTNDILLTASINGTAVKALNRDVDFTVTGTQCTSTNANSVVVVFGRA